MPSSKPSTKITVVFRNDDPSAQSDVEHERKITSYFEEAACPQTIGVVPMFTAGDCHEPGDRGATHLHENPAVVDFLREYAVRTASELALHGCTHRANRLSMPRRREYTEFRGLSFSEQEAMIREGTGVFYRCFGYRPTTFIPPWNRMDANTVRACAYNGYTLISAGPYTLTGHGILGLGMNCMLPDFPYRLRQARSAGSPAILIVNYHSRTVCSPEEIAELRRALRLVTEASDCEVLTLQQAAIALGRETVETYNYAGKSEVAPTETADEDRGRAYLYERPAKRCSISTQLTRLQADAHKAYRHADYDTAAALAARMDGQSRRVKWMGRLSLGLLGLILSLGVCATVSHCDAVIVAGGMLLAFVAIAMTGAMAWSKATATQTRSECLAGTICTCIGSSLGFAGYCLLCAMPT